ncbi:hypothetical protein [Mycolicibacterium sp. A43C]
MNLGELTKFPFLASVWGDVATWVGSLGTTGALLLGVGTLRRDRNEKRVRQASLVTFTATVGKDFEEPELGGVYGVVFNGSESPITYVRVSVHADNYLPRNAAEVPDPHLVALIEVSGEDGPYTVGPRTKVNYHAAPNHHVPLGAIRTTLSFTDADGRDWSRDSDGRLSEIKQPTATRRLLARFLLPLNRTGQDRQIERR